MAAIVLGLCCLSSILGGGYFAYDKNKIAERERFYEDTEGIHLFYKCNYLNDDIEVSVSGEYLPKTEEDESLLSSGNEGSWKSFVITKGYKLDVLQNTDRKSVTITHVGPKSVRCSDKPMKIVRFYKA